METIPGRRAATGGVGAAVKQPGRIVKHQTRTVEMQAAEDMGELAAREEAEWQDDLEREGNHSGEDARGAEKEDAPAAPRPPDRQGRAPQASQEDAEDPSP